MDSYADVTTVYFTVGSRQNIAEAKPFPNSPSNYGHFRLGQGLPYYEIKKKCVRCRTILVL